MAFPTTGILDTFTGADENPIVTNWTVKIRPTDDNLKRLSNTLQNEFQGGIGSGWYDISTYGPDSEVWATVTTKGPTNGDQIRLYLRLVDVGLSTVDGYEARLVSVDAGTDAVRIFRLDNGSSSQLGVDISQEFTDGDGFGFEAIGSTLAVYRKSAGVWTLLDTRTDSTYTAAGYLGVQFTQSGVGSPVLDDFGGGTVVVGAAPLTRPTLSPLRW